MQQTHLEPCCQDFDQTKTLVPLPYPSSYYLATLVDGVHVGDRFFDSLPMSDLLAVLRTGECEQLTSVPMPDWVDRDAVRRGQSLHLQHYSSFLISLTIGLLHGFIIGRFSEVLLMAGYTADDWTTFMRYRDTSRAIFSWMASDLCDNSSEAVRNVMRVRAMHAVARRSVRSRWDAVAREQGGVENVGVPLSQYDLALVQMAFCAMTIDVLQRECEITLSSDERRDYVHLWRYIGHLLGIEPRYNIAADVRTAMRAFDEFLSSVPPLSRRTRGSSVALVQSCVRSFGTYTLASRDFFRSLLFSVVRDDLPLETSWSNLPLPQPRYQARITRWVSVVCAPAPESRAQLSVRSWALPALVWNFTMALYMWLNMYWPALTTFLERHLFARMPQQFKY